MVDADNKETSSSTNQNDTSKGNDFAEKFAEVSKQLEYMNAQMQATQEALLQAVKKPVAPQEEDDDNDYNPKNLLRKAERVFDTRLRQERQKDMTIYNLAQEYPEIQTDSKIRQAVLEAQKAIPESIRDTADGYELAVMKAVQKAGLLPKSRRAAPVDDDVSLSPRGNAQRAPKSKKKVSDSTLAVAELMGIDINDEKRLKGLEEATNRDTYNKYR